MQKFTKDLIIFVLVMVIFFSYSSIDGKASSMIVKINGLDVSSSAEAVIIGGRTYIPVRAFTELLGYQVGWDNKLREATVTDNKNIFTRRT